MAGSSSSTWKLSLLLLPLFICPHQTSAASLPTEICSGSWVHEGLKEIQGILEMLPANYNLNFTDIFPSTATGCDFPDRIAAGVQRIYESYESTEMKHVVKNLKKRLEDATTKTHLMDMYCSSTGLNSPRIVSPSNLLKKLETLMTMLKSSIC